MTPAALRSLFREHMVDAVEPYLWSDTEVKLYCDEAESMFVRLTGGIADGTTTAVTDITVAPGDDWVDMHNSILKVRGATRVDTGRPIEIINYEDMATRKFNFDQMYTGPVKALIVGIEPGKARVYPISNEDVTVRMLVYRMPLEATTEAGEFVIDERHHYKLLDWMVHLAYLKQDTETYNKTKSEEAETRFRNYCAQAERELARARHKPRLVAYGGL